MSSAGIPKVIGKYRIDSEIGRGASRVVYLAWDPFHGRSVALKQIHAHLLRDERDAARYRRTLHNEALLAGQLRHPHIVRLQKRFDRVFIQLLVTTAKVGHWGEDSTFGSGHEGLAAKL